MTSLGRRDRGFTLIELLVVTSIIGIIASIAVPTFVRSKSSANEGAVIATLRDISKAQLQFKALQLVDADYNGGFEYGTLGELAGVVAMRGTTEYLDPELMNLSVGQVDADGRAMRHRYYIALFLPDGGGVGLAETAANFPNVDPGLSQAYYSIVAWPQNKNQGSHTFFVNQQGQVLKSQAGYAGTTNVPPAGCGLVGVSPDRVDSDALAVNQPGADGNTWVPVH